MIKAIIFDCFGVVYHDVFATAYAEFGGDIEKDKAFVEGLIFDTSAGKVHDFDERIAEHLGVSVQDWRDASVGRGGFNEELFVYIDELRRSYKVSMLSNIGSNGLEAYMNTDVLWEHFDDVVESAKIGFAKPEARAYETAAERLGVRLDECVFTDDRQHYVDGAIHVGMKAILFKDVESLKRELNATLA